MTNVDPSELPELPPNAVAIVGIAVHAANARDAAQLWQKLAASEVFGRTLSERELLERGVPERLLRHPRYVRAAVELEGVADFEPEFFGYTPRDAALLDPQARHLLECSWEALEDAGVDPARPPGPIGLFVGAGTSDYVLHNVLGNRELVEEHGLERLLQLGNDRDFLASRIAYALDLRGPCVGLGAACASGLLAVHSGCQSLLGRECRVALAGAASIQVPHGVGYLYEEGGLASPDGLCRTFDENAQGTLPSSASAMVTLMRLEDAVSERRQIYAVILASAYNNDGRRKVAYAAPSVEGPMQAIEEALAVAGVEASSIGYVEAHGTGTPFGDSIEISALTKAFRQHTDEVGYCVLSSNKPNLGHTDSASGVISLVKAAHALRDKRLPPLTHFRAPHPLLELPTSPFRVLESAAEWPDERGPRRALVNCLAVGGTNVHVVLEEPAPSEAAALSDVPELLVLSARSKESLAAFARRLADHLSAHPELSMRDVAFTLRAGRRLFDERRALVVSSREDAIAQLRGEEAQSVSAAPELLHLIDLARRVQDERDFDINAELSSEGCRFVSLPTYAFDRRAFWLDPPKPEAAHASDEPSDTIALTHTRFVPAEPGVGQARAGQRWLVFLDETGFGDHLVAQLTRAHVEVIIARMGSGPALAKRSEHEYRIDPDRGFEGPAALIAELEREERFPDVILHLWTVTTEERFRSATNRFHHDLERGYFALLAICQGLAELPSPRPVRLVAVTNGAVHAQARDRVLFPAKALIYGPLATVSLEQPSVRTCAIDIALPIGLQRQFGIPQLLDRALRAIAARVLPEAAGERTGIVALRDQRVFVRKQEPQASLPAQASVALRPGGTYVVIGGFGNLGYALARELTQRERVRLVLVGRTPLPDRAYWAEWLANHPANDPVSRRIELVRELEARGAEVLAAAADVCHSESMSSALTLARRRFGAIHGVIHAAGVLSESLAGGQSLDDAREAIAPEVLGARVLYDLLRREPLDFLLFLGSNTRLAPRAGTYARIAAAEFAHAFSDHLRSARVKSFDVGFARDGGMFVRWARDLAESGAGDDAQTRALLREIERGSRTDLLATAITDALLHGARDLALGRVPTPGLAISSTALSRSELKREYVAPEGDIERKLAAIWAESLNVDRVGATDDFFELGGHSVIAVRLSAKIKAAFGVNVPLALLIEAPNVRKLGAIIAEHLAHKGRGDTVQSLREWSTIVPLQPHGTRPPLFCVGGKGGNVMNLRHLATLLGRDQPVFGLQARGVDGVQEPHDTLDGMIEEYLDDLRKVQSSGPYLLAGFSGGGAMILEMARRLKQEGHVVGPLLFLDAWNPATPGRSFEQKLQAHAGLLRELGPSYIGLLAKRLARDRSKDLLRKHAPRVADRIWEPGPPSGQVEDAWEVAAAQYHPLPYDGGAVLFRVRLDRSRGELGFSDDELCGWGDVVRGGVQVIDVPGTHTSLVEEPHVRTLAQSVRSVLDRALRTHGEQESRSSPNEAREPFSAA